MEFALHINLEKSKELDEIIQIFKKHNRDYINASDISIATDMSNAYEWETFGDDATIILTMK